MKHRRAPGGGDRLPIMQFILMLLPLLLLCAEAQSNNSNGSNNNNNNSYGFSPNFNPSMAIVIVVLISAFFFLGFFSIYLRQCFGDNRESLSVARGGVGGARSRRQRGLDPEVLATFPTLVYSEIKGHKIGKGALECAVCLCEFENDETLRLLPKCNHVFHPDCIDAWLASHVTCPVCRSDLAHVTADDAAAVSTAGDAPRAAEEQDPPHQAETTLPEHVTIAVNEGSAEERKAELADLARIASQRRAATVRTLFRRSHSTGHSVVLIHQGDNHDRFTLRLPENIRREIVAAGRMKRAESVRAFPVGGLEGSTRRGYRGGGVGEGSSRGGRSIRLGRSDRWPSFLMRNISARMPAWATGRRWDGEGSTKKGESGDGSTKGKVSSVRVQFECLGGGAGGGKTDLAGGDGESSSTAALARV